MSDELEITHSKDEYLEILKSMMFGEQAFERFTPQERDTLNYCLTKVERCDNLRMTNGEKLMAEFPDSKIVEERRYTDSLGITRGYVYVYIKGTNVVPFEWQWWEAPYGW